MGLVVGGRLLYMDIKSEVRTEGLTLEASWQLQLT